jgi:hypothetical protein
MDQMSWTQRGVVLLSIVGMTLVRPRDQQGASWRADQVLRAGWTKHGYCHDQRQHDHVLRC